MYCTKDEMKEDVTLVALDMINNFESFSKLNGDYGEEQLKFMERIANDWNDCDDDFHREKILRLGINNFVEKFGKVELAQ